MVDHCLSYQPEPDDFGLAPVWETDVIHVDLGSDVEQHRYRISNRFPDTYYVI